MKGGEGRRREKPPVAPTLDLGFFAMECGGQGLLSTLLLYGMRNEGRRTRQEVR